MTQEEIQKEINDCFRQMIALRCEMISRNAKAIEENAALLEKNKVAIAAIDESQIEIENFLNTL